jgi:hypothetical protein
MYSIYGTVRGYVPSYSKYISFVGAVDVGAVRAETQAHRFPSTAFMCSPQLGIRVKVDKEKGFALNARLYYKYFALPDNWQQFDVIGVLFGVSF